MAMSRSVEPGQPITINVTGYKTIKVTVNRGGVSVVLVPVTGRNRTQEQNSNAGEKEYALQGIERVTFICNSKARISYTLHT